MTVKQKTKIYSDIDLRFTANPISGDVAKKYDVNAVKQSLRNLVLTQYYERPFQPNLGSNVNTILFEMADSLTSNVLENEIRNVLRNYEPRVTVNQIIVTPSPDENSFNLTMSFFIGNNTKPTSVNLLLQRSR